MGQLYWNFVCFLFAKSNKHSIKNHKIPAISNLNKTQSQCPLRIEDIATLEGEGVNS